MVSPSLVPVPAICLNSVSTTTTQHTIHRACTRRDRDAEDIVMSQQVKRDYKDDQTEKDGKEKSR